MIRLTELNEVYGEFVDSREIAVDPHMVSLIADVSKEYGCAACMILVAATKVVYVSGTLDEIEAKLRP